MKRINLLNKLKKERVIKSLKENELAIHEVF